MNWWSRFSAPIRASAERPLDDCARSTTQLIIPRWMMCDLASPLPGNTSATACRRLREISARFFEEEREKAVVAMSEACTEIQQVMRASLLELVSHLRDRLGDQPDGKPQRLRESTLQKLRDFLGTFDLRNVVDDQELREQVEKARALLEGVSTDALRNMPLVRAFVREGMADVAAQMDVLAGDRVSRKFRFDEA